MANTIITLRKKIAAFMSRNLTDFVYDGVDCLTQAVNNAKDFSQRAVDFEYARTFAKVTGVSPTAGGSLTTAVRVSNGNSLKIKNVKQAWLTEDNGATFYPINVIQRDDYVKSMYRRFRERPDDVTDENQEKEIVFVGQDFMVMPQVSGASTFDVYFDVIEWLPDFGTVSGTTTSATASKLICGTATFNDGSVNIGDIVYNTTDATSAIVTAVDSAIQLSLNANIMANGEAFQIGTFSNFFLEFCFDYMLMQSLVELNFFLKEDQRVSISEKALERAWNNVKNWNSTIIDSNVSVALD